VAGATVGVVFEDGDGSPQWLEAAIRSELADPDGVTQTATDGTFAITDLEEGTYVVWATQAGLARVTVPHVAAGTTDVKLRFAAPTLLAGVVVAPDGSPSTSFRLLVRGTNPDGSPMDPESHTVQSGRGAFELRGLAAGKYSLLAQTSDGRAARLDAVALADGEQKTGLRLVTTNGVALDGRIVDASTRRPIAGVHVVLEGQVGSADTDDNGAFHIPGLAADGAVRLYADESTSDDYVYDARTIDLDPRLARAPGGVVSIGEVWMMRAPRADPEGETGLECENVDGRIVVTDVAEGSPGAAAGVRIGDRIVAIEEVPASPFGDPAIDLMLRGTPATSVTVTLARGAGARRVSIVRGPPRPRPL
jgi:hypothetical protein